MKTKIGGGYDSCMSASFLKSEAEGGIATLELGSQVTVVRRQTKVTRVPTSPFIGSADTAQ